MKRFVTLLTTAVVAIAMSGMASPQSRRGGGMRATTGRPATTGLEHAETRANAHGQRGIENAEAKQARDRDDRGRSGKIDRDDNARAKARSKMRHRHSH